ncbi:Transmembrane_domain-containing protein [Hexamita inflata]|uniref:Transmembrane domain-containing protein n=1 Tax=Hexamita inflata TaxID=28002 RepID=A0AA86U736_9EUKA|nr:Transmembrane domain-containing protein [Hexamita inflata]
MPKATQEQTYEQTLTSTLIFNVIFAAVVIFIFPALRAILPGVFAPQRHMYRKPTTRSYYLFWFLDVFKQPISVYSTRGNLTTIYIVFQYLILTLYAIMALISVTILIPVYYYGTDTSWNENYLTKWSLLSMAHLEKDSIMLLIPISIIGVFTYFAMFFYEQFTIIYAFFRQRCMKRVIPENYVVLLQNLPADIDTKEKLENVLRHINTGINFIVPIPKQSKKLSKHLEILKKLLQQLKLGQQMMEDFKANEAYRAAILGTLPSTQVVARRIAKQKADKMRLKENRELKKVENVMVKIREQYQHIIKIQVQDNIEIDHLYSVNSIPPNLPEIVIPAFDQLKDFSQTRPETRYPSSKYLRNIQKYHLQYSQQDYQTQAAELDCHPIGRAVFLVCQSQTIAAEKYTTLIAQNSQHPAAMLAPNSKEIVWQNVAKGHRSRKWSYFQYVCWLIVLFIAYLFGQAQLNKQLIYQQQVLYKYFFNRLNFAQCTFGLVQQIISCKFVDNLARFLPTMINSFINAILMALLPQFLKLITRLLKYPSISQANDKLFNLNFMYLIFIVGIIQVAIPNLVNASTGEVNFTFFEEFSVVVLFQNLGKNIINLQFTFITYIISNYFTFPAFSLLNIYYLLSATVYKLGLTNYLDYNVKLRFITFNFPKQLAYISHMLVIGYIFAIVSPITNIIIFATYLMMVTIDRYMILNVRIPDVSADLSAQSNMLVNVIGAIFIGLLFMIFSTCCYFFVQSTLIGYIGIAMCFICLIYALSKKIAIDKSFKRALTELIRGDYDDTIGVKLNPAHIDSIFNDEDNYLSRYDLNNEHQRHQLASEYKLVSRIPSRFKSTSIQVLESDPDDFKQKEVQEQIKIIKGKAKQRIWDKLLAKMYIDLTQLPISVIRYDDVQDGEGERVCRLLSPEHIQTVEFDTNMNRVEQIAFLTNESNIFQVVKEQPQYDFNKSGKKNAMPRNNSFKKPKCNSLSLIMCPDGNAPKLNIDDLRNIAAQYTHPSLQMAIHGEKIINQ